MKKKNIVKSNILFNEIINCGKNYKNKYFIIYYLKNGENTIKFGIAVGKKIGKAVIRNKIKRQIRNIIDNNFNFFPNNYNYIIICKKSLLDLSFQEMNDKLVELIKSGAKNEK